MSKQPKNILSKLFSKSANHSGVFEGSSTSQLKQWLFILVLGMLAVATAAGYAFERFNYWGSIEERVAKEDLVMTNYDQKAFRAILEEFESKAERSKFILENLKGNSAKEEVAESAENSTTDEADTSTSTPTEELE